MIAHRIRKGDACHATSRRDRRRHYLLAAPAFALDMPTRKAGLWEIKMEFEGRSNLPVQTMKQCTDAATDKLMTL